MRVLFVNRPKDVWVGGDFIQLERTADELRKLGVTVDLIELWDKRALGNVAGYDIVHTFNFSMPWSQFLAQKRPGVKYVASMIYHETDKFIPYSVQQKMLDNLDAAIFITRGEMERVTKHLSLRPEISHLVPNGVDEFFFKKPLSAYLPHKPFVLTVGRVEEFKGQEYVRMACEKLGIKYVMIGGEYKEKRGNSIILPNMPQKKLMKWYAQCSVFALVSQNEVMPLVVLEAGAQKKNIVLTKGCEWRCPGAEYVPYKDVDAIAEAIKRSLDKPDNMALYYLAKKMTWPKIAKQVYEIYQKIL